MDPNAYSGKLFYLVYFTVILSKFYALRAQSIGSDVVRLRRRSFWLALHEVQVRGVLSWMALSSAKHVGPVLGQ